MMFRTIKPLLKLCQEAGIRLSLAGSDNEQLNVEFDQAPSDELLAALKANKENLITYLSGLQQNKTKNLSSVTIDKLHTKGSVPLSWQQQSMHFVGELQDDSSNYNMVKAYSYVGSFSQQKAMSALKQLIARYPILSVQISSADGIAKQRINCEKSVDEQMLFVSESAVEKNQVNFKTFVEKTWEKEQNYTFDFTGQPLLRLVHLQETDDKGVILFNLHHIVADGISISILLRDFIHFYSSTKNSQPSVSEICEQEINYFDYVLWQRSTIVSDALEQQLTYWQNRLEGVPELHQLSMDYARPAVKSLAGRSYQKTINAKHVSALTEFAKAQGITPFILLHSVFALLVARYSNQTDIVIGTPTAGRDHPQLSNLVGLFVNTIALRSDVDNGLTIQAFLDQNKQDVLSALANSAVSFDKVIETVNPQRSLAYSPLVQIMFSVESYDSSEILLPALTLKQLDQEEKSTKFDLDLMVKMIEGEMTLRFNYDPNLFESKTIECMAVYFIRLLHLVQENPQQTIAQLELVDKQEKHQLIEQFVTLPPSKMETTSLAQLFEQQAAKHPHNIAISDDSKTLSYAELEKQANKVAQHLVAAEVPAKSMVAIGYGRSCDAVVAMLGVLKAGCAYVPVDPSLPEKRLNFILEDASAAYLISDALNVNGLNDCTSSVASILSDKATPHTRVDNGNQCNDLAYVIYTSGSTGTPKGVMVEQGNVIDLLTGCHEKFQFNADDRFSVFHSTSFDFSVWEIYAPLSCGATACLVSEQLSKDPVAFAQWLCDRGISVLSQTPSVFYEVSKALARLSDHHLRYVVFGGEALDNTRLQPWFDASILDAVTLVNMYGITETTVHVTWQNVNSEPSDSIGNPLPGYQTFVVNGAGQLQPPNVPGELWVAGCGVARGYLNRDSLTKEVFVTGDLGTGSQRFYKTGDLVKRDRNGELRYLGRVDQQTKVRGFRIEPGEIEKHLCDLDEIEQAIVEKAILASGEQLVAFLSTSGANNCEQRIAEKSRKELCELLPHYMVPARYVVVDGFPVTSNGKTDRKKLLSLLEERQGTADSVSGAGDNLPTTDTQITLAAIWADLLSVKSVTLSDDFFALGGHSLLVARLIAAIEQHWSVKLSLKDAFFHPGLAQMAHLIDELNANVEAHALERTINKLPDGGVPQASFAQQSLWLACKADNNSSKYNIPIALRLTGNLNVEALQTSLQTIVERHDSLRMAFDLSSDNQLTVRLIDATEFTVEHLEPDQDAAGMSEPLLIEKFLEDEAQVAFDLSVDLLLRASLLKLGIQDHVLLLTLHHIAADGWSLDILLREFSLLYNAACQKQPIELEPLFVGYIDYANWQRQQVKTEELQSDLTYWQEKLKGCPARHSLPLDNPADTTGKREAGVWQQTLSEPLSKRLESLATSHNCSLFSALQAAFGVFIAITSDESDVLLGSPVAMRDSAQLQGLMGLFVNTLVFRHQIDGKQTFVTLLQNTHQQLLEGSEHLNAPFDQIVSHLQNDGLNSAAPLCQIVMNFISHKLAETSLQDLSWQNISDEFEIADLDLHFTVRESNEELSIRWLYAKDILTQDTVERWAAQFYRVLDWLCSCPHTSVNQMPLADLEDYEKVNHKRESNSSGAESRKHKLVHEKVEQLADRYPEQLALWWQEEDGDLQLTYQALNKQANKLARFLHSKGVGVDNKVGICLPRGGDFVMSMLAIQKLGASFVPMECENPAEHLSYIAQDAEIKAVVTNQSALQRYEFLSQYPMALMDPAFRDVLFGKLSEDNVSALTEANTHALLAYNIYTSGTSGNPKGVSVEHSALSNLIEHEIAEFELDTDSRVIHAFSMGFDPGVGHLYSALSAGAQVYICQLRTDVSSFIHKHELTHVSLPTALLSTIKPQHFESLKLMSVGGENCPESLAKAWSRHNRFFNLYGPTEATVYALYHECSAQDTVSIGRPIANTQCFIVNKFGQILPPGQAGELVVAGAPIATRYINAQESDQQRFFNLNLKDKQIRAYRTGDLAVFDGVFHYLGRIDKQLKIRGYRIEPGQIEQKMLHFPNIENAFVTSFQANDKQAVLLGYFSPFEGQTVNVADLTRHLQKALPAYCVPEILMEIETFPTTMNGKVDEQSLPQPQHHVVEYVAPQGQIEQSVHEMWLRALELDSLSMIDEFFDVGGNSLMAMMLVTDVKSEFGIEIEVMDVFNAKSPAGMVKQILERQAQAVNPPMLDSESSSATTEDNNVEMEW